MFDSLDKVRADAQARLERAARDRRSPMHTPVIATGWSGNMDFMSDETAFLVEHDFVEVKRGEYPFGDGQRWADPNIPDAADKMGHVWQERDAGLAKARCASREITRLLSPRAIGLRFLERLENGPAAPAFDRLQAVPA